MRRGAGEPVVANWCLVARPAADRSVEGHLLHQDLALEDVPFGEADGALKVERGHDLAPHDLVAEVRRKLGDGVDDQVTELLLDVVPAAVLWRQLMWRVLHEGRGDVLPWRSHRWVDQRWDQHVEEWALARVTVLRIVVCALHVIRAWRDADGAQQVAVPWRGRREGW